MNPLVERLERLRLRLAMQHWASFISRALLWASITACLWLVLTRLFPLFGDALYPSLAFLAVAVLAATIWAFRKRPGLDQTALEADLRLGLRERFISSLALRGEEGAMIGAVHRDAERHLSRLDFRRDFPWRPTRATRWLVLPLSLFCFGYLFLPEMDLFGQNERITQAKVNVEAVKLKAEKLRKTARVLKPRGDSPRNEALAQTALDITELAELMGTQEITEKQALARAVKLGLKLQEQRQQMAKLGAMPKLSGSPDNLGPGKGIGRDIQNGRPADAAKKIRDLQKKLRDGDLSDEEKKQLAKDLEQLAKQLGGNNSQLGAALAKALSEAGASLAKGDAKGAMAAMEAMELSLEDLASALEQMAMLESAMSELGEWRNAQMGPSKFCRNCGKALKPCPDGGDCEGGECKSGACSGTCAGGSCAGQGLGLLGAGRGMGNRVGELPEINANMKPTVLPGEMTQGKLLADIMQKTAPTEGAESQVEFIQGVFTAIERDAENALTQEEIPPGAKEFVRQYFGAIAPEQDTDAG